MPSVNEITLSQLSRLIGLPGGPREALQCSQEQNALHTLIRQRHPTPSCGEPSLYRGENRDPGKNNKQSLTPAPELENGLASLRLDGGQIVVRGFLSWKDGVLLLCRLALRLGERFDGIVQIDHKLIEALVFDNVNLSDDVGGRYCGLDGETCFLQKS